MNWHCVIVENSDARRREAARLVAALRGAWHRAGRPPDAEVHVNQGSASRCTFLLSPAACTMARAVLARYDAVPCVDRPRLARYAPLPLQRLRAWHPASASTASPNGSRL